MLKGDLSRNLTFVMIAHVVGDGVQWSVVRVGFLTFVEYVMFSDEVTSDRMQRETHQCAQYKVRQGFSTEEVAHRAIECQREHEIDNFKVLYWFRIDKHRPKRIQ